MAVTTVRKGQSGAPFLYTLNMSCPDDLWFVLGPLYQQAADSFRLNQPTRVSAAPITHLSCNFCHVGLLPG